MKKFLLAAAVFILSAPASYASDELLNPYVSVGYVFGKTQLKQDGGKTNVYEPAANLAIGTSIAATESDLGILRVSADWTYRSLEYKDQLLGDFDVLINTFGANAYYDFKTGTIVTPYVNAMLGLTYAHLDLGPGFDKRKINLAYNMGFGVAFKINDKTDIDLGYKYGEMLNKVGGFKIKNTADVFLGLRLHF
ncbi:MAG: porin family protein [Alphaproteobacteria bacterium]|nr:porin family protein [Alphaproteobacteria bacterium]